MTQQDRTRNQRSRNQARDATSVLFVCLGNICRSPLAEGVLKKLLEQTEAGARWRVASAGTAAYHVGERADPRSCAVAEANGIALEGVARALRPEDFHEFDHIVAMDRANLADIRAMRDRNGGTGGAALHLLRDFDPEAGDELDVPDPYYGGDSGFERVYEMVRRSCIGFLDEVSR